jgi:hypothetical protein
VVRIEGAEEDVRAGVSPSPTALLTASTTVMIAVVRLWDWLAQVEV